MRFGELVERHGILGRLRSSPGAELLDRLVEPIFPVVVGGERQIPAAVACEEIAQVGDRRGGAPRDAPPLVDLLGLEEAVAGRRLRHELEEAGGALGRDRLRVEAALDRREPHEILREIGVAQGLLDVRAVAAAAAEALGEGLPTAVGGGEVADEAHRLAAGRKVEIRPGERADGLVAGVAEILGAGALEVAAELGKLDLGDRQGCHGVVAIDRARVEQARIAEGAVGRASPRRARGRQGARERDPQDHRRDDRRAFTRCQRSHAVPKAGQA